MKILVLGAAGMLGNAVMRVLASKPYEFDVYGTVRSGGSARYFPGSLAARLLAGVDVSDHDQLTEVFARVRPHAVINCVGVVKQLASAKDPLTTLPLNAMLPHRLARLSDVAGARLIHVSTDCVFSGAKGRYREEDEPDARDLYGMSKHLGEVHCPHAITLRTSIIGHELDGSVSLVDWFLKQEGPVNGFRKAIFSGLPTNELACVIGKYILTDPSLCGLYHVSADPISKYDLLKLVGSVYAHDVEVLPSDAIEIDRSLDSTRLRERTGYRSAPWRQLVEEMRLANAWRFSIS